MLSFISIWTHLVDRIEAVLTEKLSKPKSVSTSPFILTFALCVLELDWALSIFAILQNLHCGLFLGTSQPDVQRVDCGFLQPHKGLSDGPQPVGLVSLPYRGHTTVLCSDVTILLSGSQIFLSLTWLLFFSMSALTTLTGKCTKVTKNTYGVCSRGFFFF